MAHGGTAEHALSLDRCQLSALPLLELLFDHLEQLPWDWLWPIYIAGTWLFCLRFLVLVYIQAFVCRVAHRRS